ncbi:HEPN domain-containing protein [uncultured Jannaschia sp.]|uniref:HEPN domain-containing protein n=1 Tax=uncultured Jannaschia sp. TaxID=293347 RepID=UPI002622844C|nr:HEPN domain-containing protein [uncultured Jannaschia sp.]
MPSSAFALFNGRRRREVVELADVFEAVNDRRGPNTKHALLNGALVLLVSSWEIYCEEVCRQAAQKILERNHLRFDQITDQLRRDLLIYAGSEFKGNQDPLDEKVALLPDEGWKQLLSDRLDEYIRDFNTPKFSRQRGKDLDGLFRLVLGARISAAIDNFLAEPGLCNRLDAIVTLRGEIAHTGEAAPEDRLTADTIRQHTASFVEAAAATDVVIHRDFRERFGFAPWHITNQVREAIREPVRNGL